MAITYLARCRAYPRPQTEAEQEGWAAACVYVPVAANAPAYEAKEDLIAMAKDVCLKAKEAGQFSAAVAAIRELGVLTGLRIERSERGAPHEFAHLSDAQLLEELRQLGYELRDLRATVEDVPPSPAVN